MDVTVEGNTIMSTPNHAFYSPVKGWMDARDLQAGNILVQAKFLELFVKSKVKATPDMLRKSYWK